MRLASSGCCDCWMPVKAEGLSAHFIMELLMRPGPTPRAQGGSRRTSDGGRWEAPSGTPTCPGCWRGGSEGGGGTACECGEWCCCWWVLLQGELGDPLLSRGCVKRSLPARRTHRPPLQGVCGESCFCSNRKWQVKRSVSIKICLRCSLVPERKSLFPGLLPESTARHKVCWCLSDRIVQRWAAGNFVKVPSVREFQQRLMAGTRTANNCRCFQTFHLISHLSCISGDIRAKSWKHPAGPHAWPRQTSGSALCADIRY